MFHNCTSKRCNFTGLLAPNLCESLRGMTSVVDWRHSVAIKPKQTGQRLLIANMHMPRLCANTDIYCYVVTGWAVAVGLLKASAQLYHNIQQQVHRLWIAVIKQIFTSAFAACSSRRQLLRRLCWRVADICRRVLRNGFHWCRRIEWRRHRRNGPIGWCVVTLQKRNRSNQLGTACYQLTWSLTITRTKTD